MLQKRLPIRNKVLSSHLASFNQNCKNKANLCEDQCAVNLWGFSRRICCSILFVQKRPSDKNERIEKIELILYKNRSVFKWFTSRCLKYRCSEKSRAIK